MIGPIYAEPIENCLNPNIVPIVKPIRIFQFIMVATLFGLSCKTVYQDSPYGQAESAAILALFGTYLLITTVDIISQCGNDPIPDTPMFLFGILGMMLFFVAACDMYVTSKKEDIVEPWRLLAAAGLSIACAILFLLDITLLFLYGY